MVDPIINKGAGASSLIRAQQAANAANQARLVNPTIITQTRNAAVVPVRASSVPQTTKLAVTSDRPLPRGSLVDKLV
jgi:hypothetical protein